MHESLTAHKNFVSKVVHGSYVVPCYMYNMYEYSGLNQPIPSFSVLKVLLMTVKTELSTGYIGFAAHLRRPQLAPVHAMYAIL